jgi:hypothetical protein
MFHFASARGRVVRTFAWALVAACVTFLSGCATAYVDGSVKDIPDAQFAKPAQPEAVQVIVEFQTKGAPNARATELVKPMVLERIKATGLFADVQDKPNGGGLLSVRINNIALTDDAAKQGFMTGLTFGLKGSSVVDGYECTVSYTKRGQSAPIVKTAKHAIHTSLGAGQQPPPGAVQAPSLDGAVRIVIRQIVGAAMKELSDDPAFK